jgi:Tol biopolymer transport system component
MSRSTTPLLAAAVAAFAAGAAPPPKPAARDPVILFWWHTRPALVKPDGTGVEKLPPFSDHKDPGIGYARFSPDGRRILATTDVEDGPGKTRYDLFVRDPHAEGTGDRIGTSPHPWAILFWTPDGAAVIGTEQDASPAAKAPKEVKWVTARTDLRTNRRTPVAIPTGVFLADVSADGKTFLAARWAGKRSEAGLVPADKPAEFTPLTDGTELVRALRLSPDGRRALVCRSSGAGRDGRRWDLLAIDMATKRQTPVAYIGNVSIYPQPPVAWSPDGKRIAYVQIERVRVGPDDKWDYQLTVCNADGTDAKMILRTKDQITSVDWR